MPLSKSLWMEYGICDSDRLSKVVISGKSAHVTARVDPSAEKELHQILLKIDSKYNKSYQTAEEAKKMSKLVAWYTKHVVIYPYYVSITNAED